MTFRGKAGRVQGNMAGLLAVVKGTPTTYNKDFQVGGIKPFTLYISVLNNCFAQHECRNAGR